MLVTFKFAGPTSYTPSVSIVKAEDYALLGTGVSEEPNPDDAPGHFTCEIEVGSYTGPVFASFDSPEGTAFGKISSSVCELSDVPPSLLDETIDLLNEIKEALEDHTGINKTSWDMVIRTSLGVVVPHCTCWVSTDVDGNNLVSDTIETNNRGEVSFLLAPGTYYLFRQKDGFTFSNPKEFTVA